ncbi:MAG: hypothetical protein AAB328_13515, partial [candidate division NC10 bacterium]
LGISEGPQVTEQRRIIPPPARVPSGPAPSGAASPQAKAAGGGTIIGIPQEEAEGGPAITPPEVAIAQVRLSVSWQETRRNQEAVVVTYVGSKAPSATEQEE